MNRDDLKISLEQLQYDFRYIPDREKNFVELQKRLEELLKITAELKQEEREPLIPLLKAFQTYLQEHLQTIQNKIETHQRDPHRRALSVNRSQRPKT